MSKAADISANVRKEIEGYLDEVDSVLQQSDVSRSERRALCDELECQIVDMLDERSGSTPSVADVKALLAEMDPPSRFARQDGARQTQRAAEPRVLPLAIWAAVTAVLGIIVAFMWAEWRGTESDRLQAAVIAFLVTSLALAMGVAAIREIRRNPRTNRGYLLACIGVISLPICLCLWANRQIARPINIQLAHEVADYTKSSRMTVLTADDELVTRDASGQLREGETIVDPPKGSGQLPFIPWITTPMGVRLFSIASCFGPTVLLTLVLAPLFYWRFRPLSVSALGPNQTSRESRHTMKS